MATSEAPAPSSKWGNRGTGSGFRPQVIDAISRAVAQTPGCVLLDVDAGPSTNRTVYTFVGQPKDVVEGALNAARAAFQLIDMSQHKGEGSSRTGCGGCPARRLALGGPQSPLKGLRRSPPRLRCQAKAGGDLFHVSGVPRSDGQ